MTRVWLRFFWLMLTHPRATEQQIDQWAEQLAAMEAKATDRWDNRQRARLRRRERRLW